MNDNHLNYPYRFTRLVLSGGGAKGIAILGALHYIYEGNGLNNIEEYWGTSIGSVICYLLIIGYTPFEIFHEFFMLKHLADPKTLDIQTILQENGFCPIELFGKKIKLLVEKKCGDFNPTFQELYIKFNKKLNIIGTNIDKMSEECFNIENNPDMKIIDALEISCDLPYIFTHKKYNNNTYVDGGFINNYPINLADNNKDYCLGICVFETVEKHINYSFNDHINLIYRLLYIPIMQLYKERIKKISDKFTNIELQINNISIIEMSPNNKKKVELFSNGYRQSKEILENIEKEYIERKLKLGFSIEDSEKIDIGEIWLNDF
jgi:predicted acylesterase/phospholipase RssA